MASMLGGGRAEYTSVATEGDFGSGVAARFPAEAAEWQCGEQRLALRQTFNANEIEAAKLVKQYDSNRNKVLEPVELQQMLTDYNSGKAVKQADLDFIMAVADKDRDSKISQDEILFALRAWYAYVNMPATVAATFTKYELGGDMLPPVEKMREIMVDLNQQQPVGVDEASYVRNLALTLGASESKVSLQQMRQAVSAWYLHIERGETAKSTLLQEAASNAHQRICSMRLFGRLCQGECDYKARGTRLVLVAIFSACVVVPLLELVVARAVQTPSTCEHPQLGTLLWWTGVTGLAHTAALIMAMALRNAESRPYRIGAWTVLVSVTVVLVALYWYGMSHVVSSTAQNCTFALWQICQLVYIVIPFFLLVFACCGVPCLYCCVGSAEFVKAQGTDESLRKP